MKCEQGTLFLTEEAGATFSPDRTYRYLLWRRWSQEPPLCVVGLNPSVADEIDNDPTISRLIGHARRWGYGGLHMLNLFAFRATDPADMKKTPDPVGPCNDGAIFETAKDKDVLAAWGNHGDFKNRSAQVVEILKFAKAHIYCLGKNANGSPKHPLYLRGDTKREQF